MKCHVSWCPGDDTKPSYHNTASIRKWVKYKNVSWNAYQHRQRCLENYWTKPNLFFLYPGGLLCWLLFYLCVTSCQPPVDAVLLWTVSYSECCDQEQHHEDSCAPLVLSCLALTDAERDLEGLEGMHVIHVAGFARSMKIHREDFSVVRH